LDWESGIEDFDVSLLKDVVDDGLVLFDGNGASGVDNDAAGLAAIDSCSEQFSLEMSSFSDIDESLEY